MFKIRPKLQIGMREVPMSNFLKTRLKQLLKENINFNKYLFQNANGGFILPSSINRTI